jgi:GH35 family endo-1,4-beta-xylanase
LTTPYTSIGSDLRAYVQAVGLAVRRYAGHGLIWEIYNEPDLLYGEDVNVGVPEYLALAKPTALAIRANDSTALILTGGTSGRDEGFPFAKAAGKALAPYVDGVSIHPYGIDYNSMGSAVVEVSLATGKTVYVTEWATYGGQGLGQAMASAKGLTPIFCVYEYQEQASEKASNDVDWGLVDTGAWVAFAAAAQQ